MVHRKSVRGLQGSDFAGLSGAKFLEHLTEHATGAVGVLERAEVQLGGLALQLPVNPLRKHVHGPRNAGAGSGSFAQL